MSAGSLLVSLELAVVSQERGQLAGRDRLLVLAAADAIDLGLPDVAAECRAAVLLNNPRHIVRRWDTIGEAAGSEAFETFLATQRRMMTAEQSEHLLESLGRELPPRDQPRSEAHVAAWRLLERLAALASESGSR